MGKQSDTANSGFNGGLDGSGATGPAEMPADGAGGVHGLPYRLFFDSSNDAMFVIPLTPGPTPPRFLDANRQACRLLGCSRDELRGMSPLDLKGVFDQKLWKETLSALDSRSEFSFETQVRNRRGRSWPVQVSVKRIELDGVSLAMAIARDLSRQAEAEYALRQNEKDLEALINAHPESVVLATSDTTVLRCNQVGAERFGSTPESLKGQRILDLIPADVRANRFRILDGIIQSGQRVSFQDFRNGMHLDHTVSPVGAGPAVERIAIFSRDVTGEFVRHCIENLLGDIDRSILQGGDFSAAAHLACARLASAFNSPWVSLQGVRGGPYHGGNVDSISGMQACACHEVLSGDPLPEQVDFMTLEQVAAPLAEKLRESGCEDIARVPIRFSQAEQGFLLVALGTGEGLRDSDNLDLLGHVASRLRVAWGMTQELQQLNLLRQALDSSKTAALLVTLEGRIVWCNQALLDGIRTTEEQILGRQTREYLVDTDDSSLKSIAGVVRAGEIWTGESDIRRADGTVFSALQSVSPVFEVDGTLGHYIIIQEDITERKKNQAHIRYLAEHDPLTGLHNRTSFMEHLEALLEDGRRSSAELSLLYLDIDHFKSINDRYGHDMGDQLLVQLAERILGAVRKEDLVCRLGGDEFVVVLRHLNDPKMAERVAAALLAQLAEPIVVGEQRFTVGASIGISVVKSTEQAEVVTSVKAVDLMREADSAMYQAKRSGRNRYRVFAGVTGVSQSSQLPQP